MENLTVNPREALYDYILTFCTPAIDADHIFWGRQNDIALPTDEDYVIFAPLNNIRHGTGFQVYEKGKTGEDSVILASQKELIFQIDCYSPMDLNSDGFNAQLRAESLETLSRTPQGAELFLKHGLNILYSENARDLSIVNDSNRYVSRWSVNLHLSLKFTFKIAQDYFTSINLDLMDADSRVKP